jgi:ubiquinone/menaquinone biosynthesis C-methylase UbiE
MARDHIQIRINNWRISIVSHWQQRLVNMRNKRTTLTPSEARAFYDKFGKKQDTQDFYENPALDELISHANFYDAQKVFELGCGTGKFASRLLEEHLSSSARYLGCDVSATMLNLATQQLSAYSDRAKVVRSDGSIRFPLSDRSVDRVISNYILDLLSEEDILLVFAEAHRVLTFEGKFCLVSLTKGVSFLSRIVPFIWMEVFSQRPTLVGGCRPILLESYLDKECWQLEYQTVLTPFGVPSEVFILIRR